MGRRHYGAAFTRDTRAVGLTGEARVGNDEVERRGYRNGTDGTRRGRRRLRNQNGWDRRNGRLSVEIWRCLNGRGRDRRSGRHVAVAPQALTPGRIGRGRSRLSGLLRRSLLTATRLRRVAGWSLRTT